MIYLLALTFVPSLSTILKIISAFIGISQTPSLYRNRDTKPLQVFSSPLGLILMNQSVVLSFVLMLNTPDLSSSPFSISIFLLKLAMLQAWSYLVSGSLSVKDQEVDTIGGFLTPGDEGCKL